MSLPTNQAAMMLTAFRILIVWANVDVYVRP